MHVVMSAWQSCDMQAALLQPSHACGYKRLLHLALPDSPRRSSTASSIDPLVALTSHLNSSWSPVPLRSCPSGRKLRPAPDSLVIVLSRSAAKVGSRGRAHLSCEQDSKMAENCVGKSTNRHLTPHPHQACKAVPASSPQSAGHPVSAQATPPGGSLHQPLWCFQIPAGQGHTCFKLVQGAGWQCKQPGKVVSSSFRWLLCSNARR